MKESEIRPEALFARYLELVRQGGAELLQSSGEFVSVPCPGCGAEDSETVLKKEGFQHELCGSCGPNVGLLLDSWHWHHDPDASTDTIVEAGRERIVHVHLNDSPGLPPAERPCRRASIGGTSG